LGTGEDYGEEGGGTVAGIGERIVEERERAEEYEERLNLTQRRRERREEETKRNERAAEE
jgi:hypothetical protein